MTFLPSRRRFLSCSATITLAGAGAPVAMARSVISTKPRHLAFDHTHTREHVSLVYATTAGHYVDQALARLNYFLRDHYTNEVGTMDPQLFDILHRIGRSLSTQRAFQVISGYRCPATNERLRTTRSGGVAKRSLHMDGKAIDIRLPGVPLAELRDAALSLRAGGVGFYPGQQFIHIDTGRVRSWGS
jgi:uncharacterized protein YcbK (DUF882 family)